MRRKRNTRARSMVLGSLLACLTMAVAIPSASVADTTAQPQAASRILAGVRVAGVDVGGLTASQAQAAVISEALKVLQRPIEVRVGDLRWSLWAQTLGARVDVDGPVAEALAVGDTLPWGERLFRRLTGAPVQASFDLEVTYDNSVARAFARSVAPRVERMPRDAFLDWVDGELVAQHARAGAKLDTRGAIKALRTALRGDSTEVRLPMTRIPPTTTGAELGDTIIVLLSKNRLYLYQGVKLARTYSVATGQSAYPTPLGRWTIINKRENPTWYNPAIDSWGADMPESIPPGPDNPLGTRALDLSAPGIRIHGTYADSSIGTYASHGCIRMHIPESEELFDLVGVGTPVIIVD